MVHDCIYSLSLPSSLRTSNRVSIQVFVRWYLQMYSYFDSIFCKQKVNNHSIQSCQGLHCLHTLYVHKLIHRDLLACIWIISLTGRQTITYYYFIPPASLRGISCKSFFTEHQIRHTVLSNISEPHSHFLLSKTNFGDEWRLNRNNAKIRYFTPLIINVKPKISQEYCMEMSDENSFTVSLRR